MDYFSALTTFHTVADTQNFITAAKSLGLAVSSATRQINQLEETLGVRLFHRSTRQIALTNAGIHYHQQTQAILDDLHRANTSLKAQMREPEGQLRITYPPSFSPQLAPIFSEFTQKYPKIRLELYSSDDFIDLHAQRFDLALRLGQVSDTSLIAKTLAPQKRLLCASPRYLAKYGIPYEPIDLKKHNCLQYAHRGYAPKWHFSQDKRKESLAIHGNLRGNDSHILLTYALDGLGIAHLPDWLIAEPLADGRLVSLLTDWHITPSDTQETDAIYLLYPPNSHEMLRIQLLVDLMMERLGAG